MSRVGELYSDGTPQRFGTGHWPTVAVADETNLRLDLTQLNRLIASAIDCFA